MHKCLALGLALTLAPLTIAAQDPGEWKDLFDGKTLDGWVQRGGKAKYRAEDGTIIGTTVPNTPNSFLCTEEEYGDFELEYEVKVDPKLNSGVQIRSHSHPDYLNGRVHGYQVEIDPSDRAWSGGIYEESRRGWLANLKDNEAAQKAFKNGEWNKFRVVAQGPELKTWVNGVAAANLHDGLTAKGFIALQVHSIKDDATLEVSWRNLRLRELPPPTTSSLPAEPPSGAVVLFDGTGLDEWMQPDGAKGAWKLIDNEVVEVVPKAKSMQTRRKFRDARFHVEFRVPEMPEKQGQARGNSGVYLHDRYEIQILDSSSSPTETAKNGCGSIYEFAAPLINVSRQPMEWQTFDIDFRAPRFDANGTKTANARVTVHQNGVMIHSMVGLPEPTGSAKKKGESPDPQPLVLQEHGDPVQFRNIWVVEQNAETLE